MVKDVMDTQHASLRPYLIGVPLPMQILVAFKGDVLGQAEETGADLSAPGAIHTILARGIPKLP